MNAGSAAEPWSGQQMKMVLHDDERIQFDVACLDGVSNVFDDLILQRVLEEMDARLR